MGKGQAVRRFHVFTPGLLNSLEWLLSVLFKCSCSDQLNPREYNRIWIHRREINKSLKRTVERHIIYQVKPYEL